MSRVTIRAVYQELNTAVETSETLKRWTAARNIEIVPRKMVEMIMQDIRERKAYCEDGSYADFVLGLIHDYAESLLKQFEEDKE